MKNSSRCISTFGAIILGAVVVVTGGIIYISIHGRFGASPSSSSVGSSGSVAMLSNGWKRYTNTAYHFSVEFPSNMPVQFSIDEQQGVRHGGPVTDVNLNQADVTATNPGIRVTVYEPINSQYLHNAYMMVSPNNNPSNVGVSSEDLSIGGTQGYLVVLRYPTSPAQNLLALGSGLHDGYKLGVILFPTDTTDANVSTYKSLLQKIAATITFTD